jgi:hypothetical protein
MPAYGLLKNATLHCAPSHFLAILVALSRALSTNGLLRHLSEVWSNRSAGKVSRRARLGEICISYLDTIKRISQPFEWVELRDP